MLRCWPESTITAQSSAEKLNILELKTTISPIHEKLLLFANKLVLHLILKKHILVNMFQAVCVS